MDWTIIITIVSIIATIANVYQKKWCFVVWFFTNAFWTVYDFMIGAYAQSVLFAVYTVLAIMGMYQWTKKTKDVKQNLNEREDEHV